MRHFLHSAIALTLVLNLIRIRGGVFGLVVVAARIVSLGSDNEVAPRFCERLRAKQ